MYILKIVKQDKRIRIYCDDELFMQRSWASEKLAIQFIDRWAARLEVKTDINIIKLDGSEIFRILEIPEKPIYHKWRKANVLNLGDRQGKYNKLICENCGLIVRHYYERNRHFREEFQCCNKECK